MKSVWYGSKVWIEQADAQDFSVGENVTFINWGNLIIKDIKRSADGKVSSVDAALNLDNKDFKKTQKITWLAEVDKASLTECVCVEFDHLITKPVLGKDEDFKQYINKNSRIDLSMIGDPELKSLKKGDIIQLQRRGFFICDSPYEPASRHSGRESPCILFNIPDGHVKDMPTSGSKHKAAAAKESSPAPPESKKAPITEKQSVVDVSKLKFEIEEQGQVVRQLKSSGASKDDVTAQINKLLALKKSYKDQTGQDFVPSPASSVQQPKKEQAPVVAVKKDEGASQDEGALKLTSQIEEQGLVVRNLKASGAPKDEVTAQVNKLLALKKGYKEQTGKDFVPAPASSAQQPKKEQAPIMAAKKDEGASQDEGALKLTSQIEEQGLVVRNLKASGAPKDEVTAQVNKLLALKKSYKEQTGKDFVPAPASSAQQPKKEQAPIVAAKKDEGASQDEGALKLTSQIEEQGLVVRNLKASGASKDEVTAQVNILLELKKRFKELTGKDFGPASAPAQHPKKTEQAAKADKGKKQDPAGKKGDQAKKTVEETGKQNNKSTAVQETQKDAEGNSREVKKVTRLGLEVKKEDNFSEWYSQHGQKNPLLLINPCDIRAIQIRKLRIGKVITKGEMIEYYDVSGCYVLRPWAFGIWERISEWFDSEIKKIGFENCYFPMFVSAAALETEKEHIADFAPEVAWVTKSGQTELAQPIAIRPTSETVMYPSYAKWVQSHRDLPIKLNQWCSVVRWEFKHPQPFLRTREFLWQEGHSAYATYAEAEKEVYHIIDLYEHIYEKLLAIPVVKGKKTLKEKFAGGDYTTTVEVYIPGSGRGIQAATSHHLGQNFSRMFNISHEDPETHQPLFAYQNSWAITTRSIGIIVMVHGDNKGLVLPPRIAQIQVVVVPCGITAQLSESNKTSLLATCDKLVAALQGVGIRVRTDYRDNYSPGWKFNHWELKGVPVRIELGPRDVEHGEFVAVRRDTSDKVTLKLDSAAKSVPDLLNEIHDNMFARASQALSDNLSTCYSFADFCRALDKSHVILAPFCGAIPCEEKVKLLSARDAVSEEGAPAMGAKGLCIPFKQPADIKPDDRCICPDCPNKPQMYTLFGRSY